jgi:hypothetical protein
MGILHRSAAENAPLTLDPLPFKHSGGPPLGYFDWNMIGQMLWNGAESAILFGAAALAMDTAFQRGWISKFD